MKELGKLRIWLAMSIIYYNKFHNGKATNFSSVTFPSAAITVIDLKRAIVQKEGLTPDSDLKITNVATGEEFMPDTQYIPKNTNVTVQRVPAHFRQAQRLNQPPSVGARGCQSNDVCCLFLFVCVQG